MSVVFEGYKLRPYMGSYEVIAVVSDPDSRDPECQPGESHYTNRWSFGVYEVCLTEADITGLGLEATIAEWQGREALGTTDLDELRSLAFELEGRIIDAYWGDMRQDDIIGQDAITDCNCENRCGFKKFTFI